MFTKQELESWFTERNLSPELAEELVFFQNQKNRGENPFQMFYKDNHTPKVFDVDMDVWLDLEDILDNQPVLGRCRILALVPKKPRALQNIKFAVAWCSPYDMPNWSRRKANKIVAGRLYSWMDKGVQPKSCGIIPAVDSVGDIPDAALLALDSFPRWAEQEITERKFMRAYSNKPKNNQRITEEATQCPTTQP